MGRFLLLILTTLRTLHLLLVLLFLRQLKTSIITPRDLFEQMRKVLLPFHGLAGIRYLLEIPPFGNHSSPQKVADYYHTLGYRLLSFCRLDQFLPFQILPNVLVIYWDVVLPEFSPVRRVLHLLCLRLSLKPLGL